MVVTGADVIPDGNGWKMLLLLLLGLQEAAPVVGKGSNMNRCRWHFWR